MKKKLRIKRWTILYGITCIIAFVLFLIFGTDYRIQNARYLESTEQNDIAFQSVNSKDGSVLLVWKTPEGLTPCMSAMKRRGCPSAASEIHSFWVAVVTAPANRAVAGENCGNLRTGITRMQSKQRTGPLRTP